MNSILESNIQTSATWNKTLDITIDFAAYVRKTDKTGITATFKANISIRVRHFLSIAPKCNIMYYMEANSIDLLGRKRNYEFLCELN